MPSCQRLRCASLQVELADVAAQGGGMVVQGVDGVLRAARAYASASCWHQHTSTHPALPALSQRGRVIVPGVDWVSVGVRRLEGQSMSELCFNGSYKYT